MPPVCVDCGVSLSPPTTRAKRCPTCRKAHRRERNRETGRAYYHAHKESCLEHTRRYREEHREELRAKCRAYYWRNHEAGKKRSLEYQRRKKALKMAQHDPEAWIKTQAPGLQTCERMALTALELPCGQRSFCLGCPKLGKKQVIPVEHKQHAWRRGRDSAQR